MGRKLTTPEFAALCKVTTARVRQWILEGRIRSKQYGRDHLIDEGELARVRDRKPGRPRKGAKKGKN